jgi:hypothetical protein
MIDSSSEWLGGEGHRKWQEKTRANEVLARVPIVTSVRFAARYAERPTMRAQTAQAGSTGRAEASRLCLAFRL